jgi:hypothetical protein
MNLNHATIQIIHDVIHDTEHVYIHHGLLSDADSPSNGLMNNSGIPVLGQKQNALTEL